MNTNELRIGNRVKCRVSNDAATYTVVAIDGINAKVMLNGARFGAWYDMDNIRPIPLTEDMLLKCGFVGKATLLNDVMYIQKLFGEEFVAQATERGGIKLKSLHQLQNLYFALKGKELEINF